MSNFDAIQTPAGGFPADVIMSIDFALFTRFPGHVLNPSISIQ